MRGRKASVVRSAKGSPRSSKLALLLGAALLVSLVLGVSLATATAPTVTIEAASEITYNSAKAIGHVDPADHETFYHFEYATQAQFEASEWGEASSAGFGSLAEGAGSTEVSETIGGLKPGTTTTYASSPQTKTGTTKQLPPPSKLTRSTRPR